MKTDKCFVRFTTNNYLDEKNLKIYMLKDHQKFSLTQICNLSCSNFHVNFLNNATLPSILYNYVKGNKVVDYISFSNNVKQEALNFDITPLWFYFSKAQKTFYGHYKHTTASLHDPNKFKV